MDTHTPEEILQRPDYRQALTLFQQVTLASVSQDRWDLSPRQMGVLLVAYLEEGPHTIRALAARLGVSKPAICRAIDALSKHHLAERKVDPKDRRNVYIELTEQGVAFLATFSQRVMDALNQL